MPCRAAKLGVSWPGACLARRASPGSARCAALVRSESFAAPRWARAGTTAARPRDGPRAPVSGRRGLTGSSSTAPEAEDLLESEFLEEPPDEAPPSTPDASASPIPPPVHLTHRLAELRAQMEHVPWSEIESSPPSYKVVRRPPPLATPPLAHDLERVLFSPGVHFLKCPRTGIFNFNPFLQYITQPANFDYDKLFPYVTPSSHEDLLQLARLHEKRFVGSTSTMTTFLANTWQLLSKGRPLNVDGVSPAVLDAMPLRGFTSSAKAPVSGILYKRGSVYALDQERPSDLQDDFILAKLGLSMELLLTSTPEHYTKHLKVNSWQVPRKDQATSSFIYASAEDFMLRSQLDCTNPLLTRKTFDIKTRACFPVRMAPLRYQSFHPYRIASIHGLYESFEREYYDLIRSGLIKYQLQARIGNMDGIFIAYHNTNEIFGFQYLGLEELEKVLYGNSETAEKSFTLSMRLFNTILSEIVAHPAHSGESPGIRITQAMPTSRDKEAGTWYGTIWAESQPHTSSGATDWPPDGSSPPSSVLTRFDLEVASFCNGVHMKEELALQPDDQWNARFRLCATDVPPHDRGRATYAKVRRSVLNLRPSGADYVDHYVQDIIRKRKEPPAQPAIRWQKLQDGPDDSPATQPPSKGGVVDNLQGLLSKFINR